MSKSLEEKITDIHDFTVRMESVIEKVNKHDETLYNKGWGITAQVKVIWGIGVILTGLIVKVLAR